MHPDEQYGDDWGMQGDPPPPPTPRETIVCGATVIAVYADGIAITRGGRYVGGVQWEQGCERDVMNALRKWAKR
jgi:hypothetical protein